ncbi:MAG TPA: hypothetical protein VH165_09675 [Kofleriaceae bacterium]|nr:hypothetical protein [Kofleriaceae bacterium]
MLGATLSIARADADPSESGATPPAAAAAPSADGPDQLLLPKGRVILDAYLEIGLSSGSAFKPVSISPDIWYGVSDVLTVGLVHSSVGGSGFIGGVGQSLCLTGAGTATDPGGCAHVYQNVGFDGRYKLKFGSGDISWAADGGLFINSLSDPFELDLKLGVVGRWHKDKLAVEFQPNIFVGLTNRTVDEAGGVSTTINGETLSIPVTGLYTVAPKIAVAVQLGVILPFEDAGDNFEIPLSIGGHYNVNESLNVNAAFTLSAVVGGSNVQTGADGRAFTIGGTYAF